MSHLRAGIAIVIAATAALTGCGGESEFPFELSPAGEAGRTIAAESGCNACHGSEGEGGIGPAWQGLAGSDVPLADGSSIVADTDYLVRSILEPDAHLVEGYTIRMPANALSAGDAEAIVDYIEELS